MAVATLEVVVDEPSLMESVEEKPLPSTKRTTEPENSPSFFALVGMHENPLYTDPKARQEVADRVIRAAFPELDILADASEEQLSRVMGMYGFEYNEYDQFNPYLIWSPNYRRDGDTHIFEKASFFIVDNDDRIWCNSYFFIAAKKIRDRFCTFLAGRDFEGDLGMSSEDHASAIVRQVRGYNGHPGGPAKAVLPQSFEKTMITEENLPYRNVTTSEYLTSEASEAERARFADHDHRMLDIGRELVSSMAEMIAGEQSTVSAKALRFLAFEKLFKDADPTNFAPIDLSLLPAQFSDYEVFRL